MHLIWEVEKLGENVKAVFNGKRKLGERIKLFSLSTVVRPRSNKAEKIKIQHQEMHSSLKIFKKN